MTRQLSSEVKSSSNSHSAVVVVAVDDVDELVTVELVVDTLDVVDIVDVLVVVVVLVVVQAGVPSGHPCINHRSSNLTSPPVFTLSVIQIPRSTRFPALARKSLAPLEYHAPDL